MSMLEKRGPGWSYASFCQFRRLPVACCHYLRSRNLAIASYPCGHFLDSIVGEAEGILKRVVRIASFETESPN